MPRAVTFSSPIDSPPFPSTLCSRSTLALPRATPVTWQLRVGSRKLRAYANWLRTPPSTTALCSSWRPPPPPSPALDTVNHRGLKSINAFPQTARSDLFSINERTSSRRIPLCRWNRSVLLFARIFSHRLMNLFSPLYSTRLIELLIFVGKFYGTPYGTVKMATISISLIKF